jgi:hypothetical protein
LLPAVERVTDRLGPEVAARQLALTMEADEPLGLPDPGSGRA